MSETMSATSNYESNTQVKARKVAYWGGFGWRSRVFEGTHRLPFVSQNLPGGESRPYPETLRTEGRW